MLENISVLRMNLIIFIQANQKNFLAKVMFKNNLKKFSWNRTH
jgi:hypothetical protein